MRASRQPGVAASAASTVADRPAAARRPAAPGRCAGSPDRGHRAPRRPACRQRRRLRKSRRGARGTRRRSATATPGLTSTMPHAGSAGAGSSRSPMPPMRAGRAAQAHRHVGAQPSASRGKRSPSGSRRHRRHSSAQRRRGIGRTAADAGRHRQGLVQHQMRRAPSPASRASARAARSTRLSALGRQRRGERPVDVERQAFGRLPPQRVADVGEHRPGCRADDSRRRAGRSRAGRD